MQETFRLRQDYDGTSRKTKINYSIAFDSNHEPKQMGKEADAKKTSPCSPRRSSIDGAKTGVFLATENTEVTEKIVISTVVEISLKEYKVQHGFHSARQVPSDLIPQPLLLQGEGWQDMVSISPAFSFRQMSDIRIQKSDEKCSAKTLS